MNEDFKKKLEERVDSISYNLKYEIKLKETDHQYKMEKKEMELATMAEALERAQSRRNDVGELLGNLGFLINEKKNIFQRAN